METSTVDNDTLDVTMNHGYLKPATNKDYLSSTTPITTNSNRPRVIQWDPHMGTDQSMISVVLEQPISSETNEEIKPMKLVFGQLVVETNQQQQRAPTASPINSNANLIWITLVAHVPRFSDTQVETGNQQVPLSICVYDINNRDTATDHWNFGIFTYKKGAHHQDKHEFDHHSELVVSRKRGASNDELDEYSNTSKRINTSSLLEDDQLFNQLLAPFEDSPGKNTASNNTSNTRPQPLLAPQPSILSQMTSNQQQYPPPPTSSSSDYYGFSDYSSSQPSSMLVNIQPNPTSGSSYTAPYLPYQSGYPSSNNNNSGNYNLAYSNYAPLQQPIMSSHIMNNNNNNNNNNNTTHATSSDHPFAGVLSKANLKITGDLMEMTYTWTQEEWTHGRRLVEFWRRQGSDNDDDKKKSGDETISEVECGFKPIDQETYQQQRIRENLAAQQQKDSIHKKKPNHPLVVSCIYWQERNDYFITSVDCIYLLEGLIGVQFTVEEKNRIRRNLEGFRPFTVSKCKPESADFFKLIMSFPHPKPRNIEKDVKVFSWKTLPNALRKIIRKYTPSYSSTAVVNLNK